MYSSALDPSSALPKTVFLNKDPFHSMESERLAALEQALAKLQVKDAHTQHKLDILVSQITSVRIVSQLEQICLNFK